MATCDMTKECTEPVTHIDQAGFVYCEMHGGLRRQYEPCRPSNRYQLRPNRGQWRWP